MAQVLRSGMSDPGLRTEAPGFSFEIFNYSTTEFALMDLLGYLRFIGLRWATILSIAFCGIDFAGIARLFTPEQGADEPAEVWYLFGAWILAATMNAALTWWGVSIAILNHNSLGNEVLGRESLIRVVLVFVALMVWLIRILIICSFLISVNGIAALAAPSDPPPLYLPVLNRSANTYLVTGTGRDVDGFPVSNATVQDATGKTTVTDLNGNYSLALPTGPNTLTATRSGYEIAPIAVNINGPLAAPDLTALAGCGNVMVNGALTTGLGGWDFPVADAIGGHTTAGPDTAQFHSAPTSGRTGILAGTGLDAVDSNSRGVSQVYHIPSDVDMALLGLWVYQVSTSVGTPGDYQYIQILDQNDNVLENKLFVNVNNPVWTYVEFNLNNRIGQAIKVEGPINTLESQMPSSTSNPGNWTASGPTWSTGSIHPPSSSRGTTRLRSVPTLTGPPINTSRTTPSRSTT